ncbi:MAG: sensor histidine kinase [Magnetovibrionaceae bacterium]
MDGRQLKGLRSAICIVFAVGLLVGQALVYTSHQNKKAAIEIAAEASVWSVLAQSNHLPEGDGVLQPPSGFHKGQDSQYSSLSTSAGLGGLRVVDITLGTRVGESIGAIPAWIPDPSGQGRSLIAVEYQLAGNSDRAGLLAKAQVDVTEAARKALVQSALAAGLVAILFLAAGIGALLVAGRLERLIARWQSVLDRQRRLVLSQRAVAKDHETMNNLLQADLARALARAEEARKAGDVHGRRLTEELRTPLNGITGFAELMQRRTLGPLGNPGYDEFVLRIMDSARHMTQVMDDVADAASLESGEFELSEGVVNLGDIADFCRGIAGPSAHQRSVSLLIDVKGLPLLLGDERRLRQALLNLVTNSLNQAEEGSVVRISGRLRNGGGLALTIGDDTARKGKEAATQIGILDAFPKIEDKSESGTNLSLTRKLIEKHGGSLVVAQAQGQCAVYSLYFPASRLMRDESHGQVESHPLLDVNTPAMGSC